MFWKRRETTDTITLYKLLGVGKDVSTKEIQDAYRKLARKFHPDKGGNPEDFMNLKRAHDILVDGDQRKLYDKYGEDGLDPRNHVPPPTCQRCNDEGKEGLLGKKGYGMVQKECQDCSLAEEFIDALKAGEVEQIKETSERVRRSNMKFLRDGFELVSQATAAKELLFALDGGKKGPIQEHSEQAKAVGLDPEALSQARLRCLRRDGYEKVMKALRSSDAGPFEQVSKYAQAKGVSAATVSQTFLANELLAAFEIRDNVKIKRLKNELLEALTSSSAEDEDATRSPAVASVMGSNSVAGAIFLSLTPNKARVAPFVDEATSNTVYDCVVCKGTGKIGVFGNKGFGLMTKNCPCSLERVLGEALKSGDPEVIKEAAQEVQADFEMVERAQAGLELLRALGSGDQERIADAEKKAVGAKLDDIAVWAGWEKRQRKAARAELESALLDTDHPMKYMKASTTARIMGMDETMCRAAELLAATQMSNEPMMVRIRAELQADLQSRDSTSTPESCQLDVEQLHMLSVAELKVSLRSYGVNFEGCVEKSELVKLLRAALPPVVHKQKNEQEWE